MMTQRQLEDVTGEDLARSHLGHAARNKRLVEVGVALAVSPGASLPKAFEDWAGLKGAYRLLSHEAVTHPAILSGHVQATAERCQQHPTVLCVQDTTSLIFAHAVDGDGIINHMKAVHGVIAHTALAVSASNHEVLGVLSQQVWARRGKVPAEETASQRQHRRRESEKWSEGVCQVSEALAASAEGQRPRVLHVFDKEGDNFEAMEVMEALGDGFVIRVNSNRLLETSVHGGLYLQQAVERAPVRGHYQLQVPRGPGRAQRQARLQVRACTVAVRPPRLRERKGDALKLNVVLAQEVDPPRGVKPLHWCLMTREPIATWQQCLEVIRAYEGRWRVEEFHMGLKTGCALESHQLKTRPRMENLLAVCSVIAWGMLALRDAARQGSPSPASTLLSEVQLALLRTLRPKLPPHPDTHQALRALASLGGFIGRKGG
ncbi:IS4 family transposase [Hyalangium sp.]|uniref:IS4 family transposase n=1 Tax=Hyalangium sp. TaxID=2028555 RepID=UPI002D5C74C2|nr:IS4 family transposase [Hyalangium sp.]HYH99546.1 IS4 family transposase [Hyalangium sp.]